LDRLKSHYKTLQHSTLQLGHRSDSTTPPPSQLSKHMPPKPRRKRPHEEPDGPWDLCIVLTSIAGLLTLFIWLAGNELGAEIVHDL
jgi:hypothetical protein